MGTGMDASYWGHLVIKPQTRSPLAGVFSLVLEANFKNYDSLSSFSIYRRFEGVSNMMRQVFDVSVSQVFQLIFEKLAREVCHFCVT